MSSQFGLRTSRLTPDPVTPKDGSAGNPQVVAGDDFTRAITALRSAAHDSAFDRDALLNEIADEARRFMNADSIVIALRRSSAVVCVARAGTVGPAPGTQLDSRSGISAECLRQGRSLCCKDSETDPRVDGEVCRLLGIRSIAVVPVLQGTDVVGLLEAFSARPYAFQDEQVAMLEQLASVVGQSRARFEPSSSAVSGSRVPARNEEAQNSHSATDVGSPWEEAFRLRPYQIAIMIGFLLLDLATVYWWRWR